MKKTVTLLMVACTVILFAQTASAQMVFAGHVSHVSREYDVYPNGWAAMQTLGVPNVFPSYGDIENNWTPTSFGDQRDTLDLQFDNHGPIDSIFIWETYSSGLVDSVFVQDPGNNTWHLVYAAVPVQLSNAVLLRIGFPMTSFNVSDVRIMVATNLSNSYLELDAVAISPGTNTAFVQTGQPGLALSFNGTTDAYRTYGTTLGLFTDSALTLGAWVEPLDTAPHVGSANDGAGIVCDAGNSNLGIFQSNRGSGDSIYFYAYGAQIAIGNMPGSWMHLCMTVGNDSLRAYKDGVLVGTVYFDNTNFSTGFPLELGVNYSQANYFHGSIDELFTFNRALSQAEIVAAKNITLTGSESGLTGYWQFNNCDGTSHFNSINHLRDELVGSPSCVASGALSTFGVASVQQSEGITVFPVPAHEVLNISSKERITRVQLLDLTGRLLADVAGKGSDAVQVSTAQLPAAAYLVRVTGEHSATTLKVIVQ